MTKPQTHPPTRPVADVRRETRTPVLELVVKAPVGCVGSVYHAVTECRRLSEEFTTDGSVVLRVAVELAQVRSAEVRCIPFRREQRGENQLARVWAIFPWIAVGKHRASLTHPRASDVPTTL